MITSSNHVQSIWKFQTDQLKPQLLTSIRRDKSVKKKKKKSICPFHTESVLMGQ